MSDEKYKPGEVLETWTPKSKEPRIGRQWVENDPVMKALGRGPEDLVPYHWLMYPEDEEAEMSEDNAVDNSNEACVRRMQFSLMLLGNEVETLAKRGVRVDLTVQTNDGEGVQLRDITGEFDLRAYKIERIIPEEEVTDE